MSNLVVFDQLILKSGCYSQKQMRMYRFNQPLPLACAGGVQLQLMYVYIICYLSIRYIYCLCHL